MSFEPPPAIHVEERVVIAVMPEEIDLANARQLAASVIGAVPNELGRLTPIRDAALQVADQEVETGSDLAQLASPNLVRRGAKPLRNASAEHDVAEQADRRQMRLAREELAPAKRISGP